MADQPNRKQRRAAASKAKGKGGGLPPSALAAIETAKKLRQDEEPMVVELIDGVRATLKPVSPSLIQDVQARIPDPEVPVEWVPSKEREEPNPASPAYIAGLERAAQQRAAAILDATIMMGVELEPGFEIPESWVRKLGLLGIEFDGNDPEEREFVFKKYHVSNSVLILLSEMSGISQEDIAAFRASFRD